MKTFKPGILLLTCLLIFPFVNAQTVDDIIARQIEAIGGKEKVGQVKSIVMESSLQVMGNENPTTTTIF